MCQKIYSGKDNKLYRLCENDRADLFLSATRFNLDELFTRTSQCMIQKKNCSRYFKSQKMYEQILTAV